ncbi:MAG TPA: hypothetical protein PLP17_04765 [Oligoflexia bacterium]|nr:hypothetical protein [Oligoflexia bacterium]
MRHDKHALHAFCLAGYTILLGFFFSMVEVQIEGSQGWAASLPTWRIEHHPLLSILWGGRPITGYHVWVFSFMAFVFHFPLFVLGTWSLRFEARVLGCLMFFWVFEDFFWFVFNPAYGAAKLFHGEVIWHKHMILFLPHDYWLFLILGSLLLYWSFRGQKNICTPC